MTMARKKRKVDITLESLANPRFAAKERDAAARVREGTSAKCAGCGPDFYRTNYCETDSCPNRDWKKFLLPAIVKLKKSARRRRDGGCCKCCGCPKCLQRVIDFDRGYIARVHSDDKDDVIYEAGEKEIDDP